MWHSLGKGILRYGYLWLVVLAAITGFLGWKASKVKLSYEFAKAIPADNPRLQEYQAFRQQFGDDGNLLVIGFQTDKLFDSAIFNDYKGLHNRLKKVPGAEEILSVPLAINLLRDETSEKLKALPIFPNDPQLSQAQIDSGRAVFLGLPFYRGLLYNPQTKAYLMGMKINSTLLNSPRRTAIVGEVSNAVQAFAQKHGLEPRLSGLPYIRTVVSDRIQKEMRFFLVGSLVLSAFILLLFFRSFSAMLLSLGVVLIGVIWSVGTMELFGYKITLLTALIPPLVVVIGIPNCIYFLNKYHTTYRETGEKQTAILQMISKMGIVTLFCNIAAAIGFAVFALTESAILKEFGLVAGINIMLLFFISLILIPVVLNMLPVPKPRHIRYLDNRWLQQALDRIEIWSVGHRQLIYITTLVIVAISVAGILRLKSVGFIVDDLPKEDKIYTDLKFFEQNFKGVMPLEIVVDTKKKMGVTRNLKNLVKIDSLTQYLAAKPYMGRPLTITEGLKFAKQAFFEGDSAYYSMPGDNDLIALRPYLAGNTGGTGQSFSRLLTTFMDSNRQQARISVSMMDIGSERLPLVLDTIQQQAIRVFDTANYKLQFTGSSVTFLEGSRFIIAGLKESIFWAFLLIALSMLYLFRSVRILICSLLPNIIPLAVTAGVMGWVGVPLKPSTVLVFSVALGIAVDITIRFLVNFKQHLKGNTASIQEQVIATLHATGLSIVYTSVVLTAGFVIFCFSGFGGTKALGWLTSLTLITATLANLVLLPALLIDLFRKK
jgi:predicted RND superfamily exporter protein